MRRILDVNAVDARNALAEQAFLRDLPCPEEGNQALYLLLRVDVAFDRPEKIADLWFRHGAAIFQEWIAKSPGTRPSAWWACFQHGSPYEDKNYFLENSSAYRWTEAAWLHRFDALTKEELRVLPKAALTAKVRVNALGDIKCK